MQGNNEQSIWRGVLIEEAFTTRDIFDYVRIIGTDTSQLESEEYRGEFHFHRIEVLDERLSEAVDSARTHIRDGWYFHLVKEGMMKVIFRGKVFDISRGEKAQFDAAREYGVSIGIREEQLDLEHLIENPYD